MTHYYTSFSPLGWIPITLTKQKQREIIDVEYEDLSHELLTDKTTNEETSEQSEEIPLLESGQS